MASIVGLTISLLRNANRVGVRKIRGWLESVVGGMRLEGIGGSTKEEGTVCLRSRGAARAVPEIIASNTMIFKDITKRRAHVSFNGMSYSDHRESERAP